MEGVGWAVTFVGSLLVAVLAWALNSLVGTIGSRISDLGTRITDLRVDLGGRVDTLTAGINAVQADVADLQVTTARVDERLKVIETR